jgi:hypothetical protein
MLAVCRLEKVVVVLSGKKSVAYEVQHASIICQSSSQLPRLRVIGRFNGTA